MNNEQNETDQPKTLLLVDGSSYLYRAFHALPDLRNSRNEPTGALYGVINMLRRLRKDFHADYIACVFDAKGKTFRDDLYPEYKSHRPPMPEDLASQIPPIHEAVRAMGWPLLMVEGVEADDVIGTLAKLAESEGARTVISTGDKDMAQLVNPHVMLVNTMTNEKLDEEGVLKKFGVAPERIVDYLTLVGDAVDNVPGVEKVGPKTAVKWITEHGNLDNIVADADKIKGVVGENLRKAKDWLPMARVLLTIKHDVDLAFSLHDLKAVEPDKSKLAELFDHFEFKTWLKELQNPEAGNEASEEPVSAKPANPWARAKQQPIEVGPAKPRTYEAILSESAFNALLEKLATAELISIDTETTSLDPMVARIVGISISLNPHEGVYIPLAHQYAGVPKQLERENVLASLKPILEDPSRPKLGQNLKYDKHIFANHGINLQGIVHDTLLESYVLESHLPHDMDSMALRHLAHKTISYSDVAGSGAKQIGFDQVDLETATEYAAEDTDITLRLHQHLYPQIAKESKLDFVYRNIEIPLLDVLFQVERNGVLLDTNLLYTQSTELGRKMLELESAAYELAGQPFNLNSPKQIQEILFNRQNLPVKKKTPSGAPSTDEEVLEALALDYPLPKVLLEYRGMAKLKSTYTDKLPKMVDLVTGRVHTNYSQAVAVTGRLASSDPNLQNIPVRTAEGRRIREAFIAPQGSRIVAADYSQIELRIMAHLSKDPALLQAFAEGRDIHSATAAEIFGVPESEINSEQRRYAKVINFGLIYGMSAFGLASQLGIDRSSAASYIDRYFTRYPGVAEYMNTTRDKARKEGFVETVFGRRLWLPEITSGNPARRQGAERAAINAPMQGTAADLIKLAMIQVQKWLKAEGMKTMIIMQVHDELVLEVPAHEMEIIKEKLPHLMCDISTLDVQLEVEVGVGPNWEQAH